MSALPGGEAALISSIFYSGIIDLLFSLDNVRRSAYYDSRIQRPFGDGAHILYVNGENRDDTPLGRLMQDFFCEHPEQMNYKELAKRADYFKAEAEGVNAMCELMEKFGEKKLEEGRAEGRAEGHREGMLDMARSLLALNVPVEVIEKSSGLTRAEILALRKAEGSVCSAPGKEGAAT